MPSLDATDPTFPDDLTRSDSAVVAVGAWLRGQGYPVIIRPQFLRPAAEDRRDYQDEGDLEVLRRVEVKHRHGIAFTSPQDYPYKTIIVDKRRSIDRATVAAWFYVICNGPLTHAAIINVLNTRDSWESTERVDGHTQRKEAYYEVDKYLARFVQLRS